MSLVISKLIFFCSFCLALHYARHRCDPIFDLRATDNSPPSDGGPAVPTSAITITGVTVSRAGVIFAAATAPTVQVIFSGNVNVTRIP